MRIIPESSLVVIVPPKGMLTREFRSHVEELLRGRKAARDTQLYFATQAVQLEGLYPSPAFLVYPEGEPSEVIAETLDAVEGRRITLETFEKTHLQ